MRTQGLRSTLRALWRSKLFSALAITAFAFGIASTSTVFSVIDAVILRPVTFAHPESMVRIEAARSAGKWDNLSPALYSAIRSRPALLSQVCAARLSIFTITRVAAPDQLFGLSVSGSFFHMLTARPLLGRLPGPADDQPGAPPVVLLSYQAWQQLFAGNPSVVGQTAQVDGESYTVIGVMPYDFSPPSPYHASMLWTTLRLTPAELSSPQSRGLQVYARLQFSTTMHSLQQNLDRIAAASGQKNLRLRASAISYDADPTQKRTLWLAMGMVSGLLLIGCANISSLLLARAIGRRRDFAIRLATGATRIQLIRQSLSEVFVLAFAAFALASAATVAALSLIRNDLTAVTTRIPNLVHVQLDRRSLLFSFAVTLLCALVCGVFPALSSTSINLASGLRETGNGADGRKSARRFLHGLLAVEACISLLLLLTSGLLVRSLSRMLSTDHGLRPDHVLTVRLPTGSWQSIDTKKTAQDQQIRIAKYLALLQQAQALQGVQAAALASSLPLSNTTVSTDYYAPDSPSSEIRPYAQAVTADYFKAMGIPVLAGQTFHSGAAASNSPLVLVNQAFARQYFHGQSPVGKFLLSPHSKDATQIIGVVKDSPHLDLTEPIQPQVYLNFEQTELTPFLTGLVIRSPNDPQSLTRDLRTAFSWKDAGQAVVQIKTLQTLINRNVWQPRFAAWLSSAFAVLALCLSGIGIYGVVAYVATSRQREFGIRSALGAGPGNLLRLAAIQSLVPILLGSCFGLLAFYWTSQWIASLLYETSPLDPLNALTAAVLLLLLSLAAVATPAWRASRAEPAITLRHN
jgi:predicted permease